MRCPACGHENLSAFDFCEVCLEILPTAAPAAGAGVGWTFEQGPVADAAAAPKAAGVWPVFPWNPSDLPNPLLGRDKAVKQLRRAFEEVAKSWKGRLHLLVSEYGMGKSRVASALADAALGVDPDTRVVRVRCPDTGGPYRLWDAVLRAAFDIPASADADAAGASLAAAAERWLGDEGAEVARLIAALTGWSVPGAVAPARGELEREAAAGRATSALGRFIAAVAAEDPLLIVVDHAHRASPQSLALAGSLEALVKGRPVMLVLSGSPELTDILPGWDRFPVTRLEPLGRGDARRMLELYLSGLGELPKELLDRILDRGRGNPYALKSIVRYVREAGGFPMVGGTFTLDEGVLFDLELPDTLDGVVLAQLSTLDPFARRVLARAAIVGEHFWLGALVAMERDEAAHAPAELSGLGKDDRPESVRGVLAQLVSKGFLERRPTRITGEEAFAFRSSVHFRVASDIVPATTRARLHRIVWKWLELHTGLDELDVLEPLARHAEGAGEGGQAARYLLRLARAEAAAHEPSAWRRLLEAAQELAEPWDVPTCWSIAYDLGQAAHLSGDPDTARSSFEEALTLAWRHRHRGKGATALAALGRVARDRGEYLQARAHFQYAARLFEAVADRAGLARVATELGRLAALQARFDEASAAFRKAEALVRQSRDRRGLGDIVHQLGVLHYDRGALEMAREYLEDALELRERIGDRAGLVESGNALGVLAVADGELEEAVTRWRDAETRAEGVGDVAAQATLANNRGEVLIMLGRAEEAAECLDRAIALAEAADIARVRVDALRNRARLEWEAGRFEHAEELLDLAREAARALDLDLATATVERSTAELLAARASAAAKPPADAVKAFKRAAAGFHSAGYTREAAVTLERLAEFHESWGDVGAAEGARAAAREVRGDSEA